RFFGIHPGGQGGSNFSIVADPVLPNVVYVGGDTQPGSGARLAIDNPTGDGVSQPSNASPTASGATDFTARIFRGDAFQLRGAAGPGSGQQWTWVTGKSSNDPNNPMSIVSGAGGTAPHSDSRVLAFVGTGASATLLEGDDGGLFRLTNPDND